MIGRHEEQAKLQRAIDSSRAQIVVVYGRRRVGKTFLVNEFFSNTYSFKHTAVSPIDNSRTGQMKIQLEEFYYSLKTYGLRPGTICPKTWQEAFHLLQELLDDRMDGTNQVIFIDELPWMDTPRSGFLSAFEHFCNDWCLSRKHVKLIVCGSATSRIADEMLDSKGGMYDRVTSKIYVSPFTLKECREYFLSEGFHLDDYDIIQAYMAFGGIPYYLSQFDNGLSIAQNIDALLFDRDGILADEFDKLFRSQFTNPELLNSIVTHLDKKRNGYTREELLTELKQTSGGTFTTAMSALEKSRFVTSFIPFGEKDKRFKVSDPFCRFYLRQVKGHQEDKHYWQNNSNSPGMNSWLGLAFEDSVFNHIEQVKRALGIAGVVSRESAWSVRGDNSGNGMQIDLVIDRDDRVINICEMKFCRNEFSVDSEYARKIQERIETTQQFTGQKRTVVSVLITTYGLKRNEYSGRFQKVITMEDLFS